MHSLEKIVHISRDEVGHVSILGVIPERFDWIQFRRIAGRPFHLNSSFLQKADGLAMRTVAIHHQEELAAQVTVKETENGHHFPEADVMVIHLKVDAQTTLKWGHCDSSDDRETVVLIPTILDRRTTSRSPGAANHWLQHQAAFVGQHGAPSVVAPLFSIRGQSCSRHSLIAASLRSRARRCGFLATLAHTTQDPYRT